MHFFCGKMFDFIKNLDGDAENTIKDWLKLMGDGFPETDIIDRKGNSLTKKVDFCVN